MLIRINKKISFYFLWPVLLIACSDPALPTYPFIYADGIMGTRFNIKVTHLPATVQVKPLKKQIKRLLENLNAELSTYEPDSALSLFNQNPSHDWQSIPNSLLNVLIEAQRISHLSGGAFDVSVGKLVNLWGFGVEPMDFTVPKVARLKETLAITGYQHLFIDNKAVKIKKNIAKLYLDLSAIAKGYAVDQVARLLETHGIHDYMVEIGGELRLKGQNSLGYQWQIAIEKPNTEKRMIQRIVSISNKAMATSGDYRNFFESNGTRYSHTIDPRTGQPISHQLASVTLLSDTAMTADALATAIMVLGEDQGYQFAQKHNIAALFIIKTADGFVEKSSTAFSTFFKEK